MLYKIPLNHLISQLNIDSSNIDDIQLSILNKKNKNDKELKFIDNIINFPNNTPIKINKELTKTNDSNLILAAIINKVEYVIIETDSPINESLIETLNIKENIDNDLNNRIDWNILSDIIPENENIFTKLTNCSKKDEVFDLLFKIEKEEFTNDFIVKLVESNKTSVLFFLEEIGDDKVLDLFKENHDILLFLWKHEYKNVYIASDIELKSPEMLISEIMENLGYENGYYGRSSYFTEKEMGKHIDQIYKEKKKEFKAIQAHTIKIQSFYNNYFSQNNNFINFMDNQPKDHITDILNNVPSEIYDNKDVYKFLLNLNPNIDNKLSEFIIKKIKPELFEFLNEKEKSSFLTHIIIQDTKKEKLLTLINPYFFKDILSTFNIISNISETPPLALYKHIPEEFLSFALKNLLIAMNTDFISFINPEKDKNFKELLIGYIESKGSPNKYFNFMFNSKDIDFAHALVKNDYNIFHEKGIPEEWKNNDKLILEALNSFTIKSLKLSPDKIKQVINSKDIATDVLRINNDNYEFLPEEYKKDINVFKLYLKKVMRDFNQSDRLNKIPKTLFLKEEFCLELIANLIPQNFINELIPDAMWDNARFISKALELVDNDTITESYMKSHFPNKIIAFFKDKDINDNYSTFFKSSFLFSQLQNTIETKSTSKKIKL